MPDFIDLHIHTDCSDGVYSPLAVLDMVRERGLAAFSITDHDTLDGYDAVAELLNDDDPELIPGIELSVEIEGSDLHMLAYEFDPGDQPFRDALADFQKERNQRGRMMVERLQNLGVDISFEAVEREADGAAIGRPHVAQALYTNRQVATYEEAFHRFIGKDRPAYIPKSKVTPREGIDLVHRAGGVAVMAHPYVGEMVRFLEQLVPMKLDGIEVYHYTHNQTQIEQLQHLAERFGLIPTGGSDFHGREGRRGDIGSQRVPVQLLSSLRTRAAEIRSTP